MSRRDFIALAGSAGGLALAGPEMIGSALANRHPHPRPSSLKYLDRNMYRRNTHVLSVFDPGAGSSLGLRGSLVMADQRHDGGRVA